MANVEAVEKFTKLVALAQSEEKGEPTEEARNAAVKAIQLLADDESDLIVISKTELEEAKKRVGEAKLAAKKTRDEKRKDMATGAFIGFMLGKGGIKF
jgi:hypothetical protein